MKATEEREILDNASVFFERYEREKEPFIKLYTLKFRFIAVFGKDAKEPFDEIRKIINEILFSANRLGYYYWKEQGRKKFNEQQFEKHLDEMHKHEAIVWYSRENYELEKMIEKSIEKIETFCLSIMKK